MISSEIPNLSIEKVMVSSDGVKPFGSFPELLEPDRQPVPIWTILVPSRQLDDLPDDLLQAEFEERPIVDFEQPIGDMNSKIGVDADQMGVEGRVMELRQRQAIRDHRLPQLFIRIHNDVGRIEQSRLGYMGDRAPPPIGREHRISE